MSGYRDFAIVSDSSHDLVEDFIIKEDIQVVPFYISLDGSNYLKDTIDISQEELYSYLRENKDAYPKTSLPSVNDYLEVFTEISKTGKDIICFCVSSTLSGSYQSANVAKEMLEEEFSNDIYIVDSESASLGLGLLIEETVKDRKNKKELKDIYERMVEISKTSTIYIALETLDYLKHGGRIGSASAFAGSMLKLKPIVSFKENTLSFETATRGFNKAKTKLVSYLDDLDPIEDYKLFIAHGDNQEGVEDVVEMIRKNYQVELAYRPQLASSTVISHVGLGAIALGSLKI